MDGFAELVEAVRGRNLRTVKTLWKNEFINKRSDGRTVLHWATYSGSGEIVRFLISQGCDIEEQVTDICGDKSWRPIHLAVFNGNKEAVKELIEAECILDCVIGGRQTPLSLSKEYKETECQRILEDALHRRSQQRNIQNTIQKLTKMKMPVKVPTDLELIQVNSLSNILDPKTGKTLLDNLLVKKDPNIMEAIKSKPVSEQEITDWMSLKNGPIDAQSYRLLHECLLYRCIRHEYLRGFEKLCTPDIVNGDKLFMDLSTLETVAASGVEMFVERVLKRLTKLDDSWTSAQIAAKRNGFTNVALMISKRRNYLIRRYKKGYGRLHIAVHDDAPDMVEYLLEKRGIVSADEGDKTIGTALSYAYDCDHEDCIDTLQNNRVNINTVDWLGRTPLHVAISSGLEGNQSSYLVARMANIDTKDYRGLRVIDRSILHDCCNICEKLLQRGVKLNKFIEVDFQTVDYGSYLRMQPHLPLTILETIYTLCLKQNGVIYPCLLESIDKNVLNFTDNDKNTLMHLSASLLMSETCSALITKGANVHFENKKRNTPLLELLEHHRGSNVEEIEEKMIDTVNVLLRAGASCSIKNRDNCGVAEIATSYQSEKLLMAMIENVQNIDFIDNDLWNSWVDMKYFRLIKMLLASACKYFYQFITINNIKNSISDADMSLIRALYDKAEEYVQDSVVELILHKTAVDNDLAGFRDMIDKTIYVNSCLVDGESLLNYLIQERKKDLINLVIRSRNVSIFTEKKNSRHKLPLHICIETKYWDMMDVVIANTYLVNEEDDDGNTAISMLLSLISDTDDDNLLNRLLTWTKLIIAKNGDIYHKNKYQKLVIDYCTDSTLKFDLQAFARRHIPTTLPTVPVPQQTSTIPVQTSPILPGSSSTPLNVCPICDDEPRDCALNCGHIFGSKCANKTIICYNCRKPITDRRSVFIN